MWLRPKPALNQTDVHKGLRMVIADGLAAEAMTTLTGGAFLTAMALLMGASNLLIGIISALPAFTNIFQLLSIWLVRRFNNRRLICVVCSLFARVSLLVIGASILLAEKSLTTMIVFLFFYYFFGSIAGPSWNAWMKDLVPEDSLGTYFAKRTSYLQMLNVILSLVCAGLIDVIRTRHVEFELDTYAIMFVSAGIFGIIGAVFLARTPEQQSYLSRENMFKLFSRPLKDSNFVHMLIFHSFWVFALNIATPFFTVYMMKGLGLSISYVIGLSVISLLCNVFSVRVWGFFSDRYSNKTILALASPLYVACVIAWCFVGIWSALWPNLILLLGIHIFTGLSLSGINLALVNIGLKLAPKEYAIVYLSTQNMVTAVFSSISPLVGGLLADYFTSRTLKIDALWTGPHTHKLFHLINLNEWTFLFLISAVLLFVAVELLVQVRETGEVDKEMAKRVMRSSIKNNLRDYFLIGNMITLHEQLWGILKRIQQKRTAKKTGSVV